MSATPHTPITATEREAVRAANDAAAAVAGTTSPNPPVGAVVLDADGRQVGVGATEPPGGRHAEVVALDAAGPAAAGGTLVVTLEPCNHTGRTGPCTQAVAMAGISRVVYVHPEPTRLAGGGAAALRARGIDIVCAQAAGITAPALAPWLRAAVLSRPAVTLKFAQTLDGFTAAADGTSKWITSREARLAVHADRARRDAIVVGTGTVLQDNPRLSARRADGSLYAHQPLPVVVGSRDIPAGYYLDRPGVARYPGISEALTGLWERGARDVLVEGGAGLLASFVEAGVVDFIHAYIAPRLLGAGLSVLARPVVRTLSEAKGFSVTGVALYGDDVRVELVNPVDRAEEDGTRAQARTRR